MDVKLDNDPNFDDLNFFTTTTSKRRKKVPIIDWDVKRFHEERIKKAEFLLNFENEKKKIELEEKKEEISELNNTEQTNQNTSVPIQTCCCFDETFCPQLFGAYYMHDEIFSSVGHPVPAEGDEDSDYFDSLLSQRLNLLNCQQLLMVMATVPDEVTAKSCYRKLVLNEFAALFDDIVRIFLNWGASLQSLRISGINIKLHVIPKWRIFHGKLFPHNVEYVLKYIQTFHSKWQRHELIFLIIILISSAMDRSLRRCFHLFLRTLATLINTFNDSEINETATHLIDRFRSMNILNAVFICVDLIPVSVNGDLLSTKASSGLLRILLNTDFTEDSEWPWSVLEVLVQDKREPNSYFQHLFLVVKLVENIIIKRFFVDKKQKETNLKLFNKLLKSATKLQNNMRYSNSTDDFENPYIIKEMLVRLINHCQKTITY